MTRKNRRREQSSVAPPEQPERPRARVQEPEWHETLEGVLRRARKAAQESAWTDVIVIGVRPDGGIERLTYTPMRDQYRIVGILRVALDRLVGK